MLRVWDQCSKWLKPVCTFKKKTGIFTKYLKGLKACLILASSQTSWYGILSKNDGFSVKLIKLNSAFFMKFKQ